MTEYILTSSIAEALILISVYVDRQKQISL